MSNNIVDVLVSQQIAPTPETLQGTGAFISQGATDLAPGTSYLLTQLSDLVVVLNGALALSTISWAGGTVTATTNGTHGLPVGEFVEITIAGATPVGYNGTFLCFVPNTTHFTYVLASNPGTVVVAGGWTLEDVGELNAMATTFFAQGSATAVFVLELGVGSVDDGVAALSAYLIANPNTAYKPGASGFFYSYLFPRSWDGNANLLALLPQYESTVAKTYFFVTTTLATRFLYTNLMKDVVTLIEDPQCSVWGRNALTAISWSNGVVTATTTTNHGVNVGDWFDIEGVVPIGYNGWHMAQLGTSANTLVFNLAINPGAETLLGNLQGNQVSSTGVPSTEFSLAAAFRVSLHYDPSPTNRVTQLAFSFLFGVTPFKQQGRSSLLASLKANAINFVNTGAEGGISTAMLSWGTTMDGRDFTYWYSVDWEAINCDVNVSNAIINGSNNPVNPLYYSQNGIDRLQDVVVSTTNSAVTIGLANGQPVKTALLPMPLTEAIENGDFDGKIVVNAVPFLDYLRANPGHYKIGEYDGLSILYIPNRGFIHVQINLVVTDFVVAS